MSLPLISVPSDYTGSKDCFCGEEPVGDQNPLLTHARVNKEDTTSRFHVAHRSCWRDWALAKNNGIIPCPECKEKVDVRPHLSGTVLADNWSNKARIFCKYAFVAGAALTAIATINTCKVPDEEAKEAMFRDIRSFTMSVHPIITAKLESVVSDDVAGVAGAAIAGVIGAGVAMAKVAAFGAAAHPWTAICMIVGGTMKLSQRIAPELQPAKLFSIMTLGTLAIAISQKLLETLSL